jgi:hypothetical protein
VDEAIHLYHLGWSLARVGEHLDVDLRPGATQHQPYRRATAIGRQAQQTQAIDNRGARKPTTKELPTPPQRTYSTNLPTDDELSAMDDPVEALLQLWRNRGVHERRATVAAHILASRYATEDLAWRLPIVDLEQHSVWGTRVANKIVEICGDSPARWQEFT